MASTSSRLVKLIKEERNQLIYSVISDGTKWNTKYSVNLYKKWLDENYGNDNFEALDEQNPYEILAQFYMEVRTEKEEFRSKITYVTVRAGISRYLDPA